VTRSLVRSLPLLLGRLLLASGGGAEAPSVALDTEPSPTRPLAAEEAASRIQLPPGFRATVFAAEPDVRQPIAMTTDARGRLWVAENLSYSEASIGYHPSLRDRILIFEDSDNDGRFDRRTVFWEGAERLTSIEVGLGGVWAICLPQLVFIPDRNADDQPDGPPEVLLDGFEYIKARHTVANGLRWGPDGWLYGRQGILGTSLLGPPGTPAAQRRPLNVGIWRYHPQRRTFEIVAEGTTNPWGMDWDARGEPFFINTVIGHLWHVIPGAHYRRMFGDDPNPHVYELLEQNADHVHWATGEVWTDVRKGVTAPTLAAGGGHAHTGLLIYQGGQWPAAWEGKLLTINLHGRRLNVERLETDGSGFVARHEKDAFAFADPWFRGIDLIAAPDGGVFVSDWSDTGECHDHEGIHRSSGRIFKLTYGKPGPRDPADLTRLSHEQLADLQRSPNDWLARQSRRVLADRAAAIPDPRLGTLESGRARLQRLAVSDAPEVHRLRALWALHVTRGLDEPTIRTALAGSEALRVWAIRLCADSEALASSNLTPAAWSFWPELLRLAEADPSPRVRLALATLLPRLGSEPRTQLAGRLLTHSEDASDRNLPLLLWYGIEPLSTNAPAFVRLLAEARIPRVQRLGARRLAENLDASPGPVNQLVASLATVPPGTGLQALLDGLAEGLAGRRRAPKPQAWDGIQPVLAKAQDEMLRGRIRDLNALFGDGRALDEIRQIALDPKADIPRRRAALRSLIDARTEGLRAVSESLLPVRDLSATAAEGLSLSDDPGVARLLIAEWPRLYGHERAPVLNVLVARASWAGQLLDAMAAGAIRRADVGAYHARRIRALQDPALTRRLHEVWGDLQDVDESRRIEALAAVRRRLEPAALAAADPKLGRQVFQAACAPCHRLFGEGAAIGPDLTGAGRDNLDYLLENLLFPSAIVPAEYRQTTLHLKDGRVLSGIVRSRTVRTVTLQPVGDPVTLETADITSEEGSQLSMMPEGQLDNLDDRQVRGLIRYLMSPAPPAP
jgi:putative membrane-bound dehydrogenase-like protein